jgi:hypothetical protein
MGGSEVHDWMPTTADSSQTALYTLEAAGNKADRRRKVVKIGVSDAGGP